MSDVAAHSSSDDTVPCGQVHRIEFCLNYLCDVIQYSFLLEGEGDAVNSMLLHFLRHIAAFDYGILCLLLVNISMGMRLVLLVVCWLPFLCRFHAWVRLYRCH